MKREKKNTHQVGLHGINDESRFGSQAWFIHLFKVPDGLNYFLNIGLVKPNDSLLNAYCGIKIIIN
jgi:hypothetical protein